MAKRIIYVSVIFLILTSIIVGLLINYLDSKTENKNNEIIDLVDDPLANYSEGRKVFNVNCASCHRIGGKNDPDLLVNLDSKMDKNYFHFFITKQDSLLKSEDIYQTEIGSYTDFSHLAISHTFINLDRNKTNAIYDYIIAEKSR